MNLNSQQAVETKKGEAGFTFACVAHKFALGLTGKFLSNILKAEK